MPRLADSSTDIGIENEHDKPTNVDDKPNVPNEIKGTFGQSDYYGGATSTPSAANFSASRFP